MRHQLPLCSRADAPPARAQCKEFRVIRHRDTDRPRGCFITVESAEGVAKALTLDNTLLRGRPLRVDVAEAKPERNSGALAGGIAPCATNAQGKR